MKKLPFQIRTLALIAVLVPLFALFVYVALRSGPLAPVSIVLATVENKSLSPALFGIGTIEARYTYKIGPTFAGRVERLDVHVGEHVKAGQALGEMDPVDLDERIKAQNATLKRATALLSETQVRKDYAKTQALRYEQLLKAGFASEEIADTKRQELLVAETALTAAREELSRVRAEREALEAQRSNLSLIAPVDGLIISRNADPGTTVVAGQAVVELIDPYSLWVNVRFDQIRARGLAAGLSAQITLRSQAGELQTGRVLRVEPLADVVTEEVLAKVVFDHIPDPMPPIGELAEVTITLPTLAETPVVPNAAIHHIDGKLGVWQVINGDLRFTPVSLGIADLEGLVQVQEGLKIGDQVVIYSENALNERRRIRIVDHIPGVTQ
ncbi:MULTISPECIES: efflux RND transporter periplasmic adaptor subunit [Aminobacterium]|jgi:RND family efflux transporter MFP subunit|uniref:efflux RND transporter periplasmic adaptor subunit n=1 Tax=Aminobacterium TaxID=81466 RepID=UPI00046348B2|nr:MULTISPECIES: efflux RND transporter periplasmic adaptor subunit [Aminobacterium]